MLMRKSFNISVALLLEHTSTILKALTTDLERFTAFDADLNQSLVSEIQSQFNESLAEGGDEVVKGVVAQKTQTLRQVSKDCDNAVKTLRYWVNKAFADDPASRKRFQLSNYWVVRNRQADFITFMNSLATVVDSLRPGLEAANTPVELLDSIRQLTLSLKLANSDQKNEKGNRTSATQERTVRLNALYANCAKFSKAAKYVFRDCPAKRKIYRIQSNNSSSTED